MESGGHKKRINRLSVFSEGLKKGISSQKVKK